MNAETEEAPRMEASKRRKSQGGYSTQIGSNPRQSPSPWRASQERTHIFHVWKRSSEGAPLHSLSDEPFAVKDFEWNELGVVMVQGTNQVLFIS